MSLYSVSRTILECHSPFKKSFCVQGNPSLVIEETETNQSVYVYKCEGSTIKIRQQSIDPLTTVYDMVTW